MKKRTIRGTLFGTYTIIILASFFALAAVLIALQAARTRSQTLIALRQQTRAAALSVDREIEQMRTMAMNISYSTRMQDRLFPGHAGRDAGDEAEKLSTLLSIIIFPNRPIDQINLYTRDGMRVSSGLVNEIAPDSAEDAPWCAWFEEEDARQRVCFSGPDAALSKFATDAYGRQFVSLVMENYDNFGNPCGYIEIKQRVSRITAGIAAYGSSYGEEMLFFDADGHLIYPLDGEAEGLFEAAREMGFPEEFRQFGNALVCCAPYLSKLFHDRTGTSPSRYLTDLRMQKAKKLLLDSQLSVKEIAERVGYPDPFHFSKSFKNAVGMSPAQYREQQGEARP